MSNLSENRINLVLDPGDFQVMQDSIDTFIDLIPTGTSLTDEQRSSYLAINVSNKVFSEDVLAESNTLGPDILPAYVKLNALKNDLDIYKQLDNLENRLNNAQQLLQDAKRVAGHEAYSLSTVIYNAIKMASDAGIPNAKAAYTKLKTRFGAQGRTGRTTDPGLEE